MRMRILLSMKYCAICAELKLVYVGGSSCATTAKQPNSTIIATPDHAAMQSSWNGRPTSGSASMPRST
jgi:hypothetical protein